MKRRSHSLALAFMAILQAGIGSAEPIGQASCFTKADNALVPFHVFQTARIPASTSLDAPATATSPYFPATDFISGATSVRDQDPRYKAYLLSWVNRCQYIKGVTRSEAECHVKRRVNGEALTTTKGNSYAGQPPERNLSDQVRSAFSSYAAADGCSVAQEMEALGLNEDAIDARARQAGIRLFRNPDRSTATMKPLMQALELVDGTRWSYLLNMCVLPARGAASSFAGFGLDFEVNDNRTPQDTSRFLAEYLSVAHAAGKGVVIAVNPLPRIASGLDDSNIQAIIRSMDYVILSLSNGATPGNMAVGNRSRAATGSILDSYARQLAIISGGGRAPLSPALKKHIVWQVPLYQIPMQDASALHAAVKREGFGGIAIFRNYVQQGGSCSREPNQLTACLALGQCRGDFGRNR